MLPVDEALSIPIGTARGVGASHRAGLIRRDIKPGNLYLERDREGRPPRVRVLDFGIAQIVDPEITATMLTVFGHVPTRRRSLLQSRGMARSNSTSRATYIASAPPVTDSSPANLCPARLYVHHASAMRTPLGNAGASGALTRVMMQALALSPIRCFPDGNALADALEDVLRRMEVTAPKRNLGLGGSRPREQEDGTDEEESSTAVDLPVRDCGVQGGSLQLLVAISVFALGWCARTDSSDSSIHTTGTT